MAYLNQERKKEKTKLDVDEISRVEFINVVVAWDTKGESLQKKRKEPLTAHRRRAGSIAHSFRSIAFLTQVGGQSAVSSRRRAS